MPTTRSASGNQPDEDREERARPPATLAAPAERAAPAESPAPAAREATAPATRSPVPDTMPTAAATVSVADMATLMTSWQQSFERLLDRVLPHEEDRRPATPAAVSCSVSSSAHFAACKTRYSGAPDESLDGFIDAIEAYKDCAGVSDVNALRGISMLLTHDAATWWQGVKSTITTWSSAVQCMRSAFGDSRPPHRLYRDLFNMTQESEKTLKPVRF